MCRLVISVLCLSLSMIACPFSRSTDERKPIGPDVSAHVLIYFVEGTTQEQINGFSKNVLGEPPPGVRVFLRVPAVEGHEGIALTFFTNAPVEQRQQLVTRAKTSPGVYRVFENTAPDSVITLRSN